MNIEEVKGNLEEQRGKIEQKFAALTENDQMFEAGKKKEIHGKLQIRLGKTREELRKIIVTL